VSEGVKRNAEFQDLYIKMYLTGGVSPDAMSLADPKLLCLFLPAGGYPPENFVKGVSLVTFKYQRFMPEAKSTNYMAAVVAVKKAREEGATDALFLWDRDYIVEGTTFNFFGIKKGVVCTPDKNLLYGVTRKFVIQLAEKSGIPVRLQDMHVSELSALDEAFLTSTTREITPVVKVDSRPIGNGAVGPTTQKLMNLFKQATTA